MSVDIKYPLDEHEVYAKEVNESHQTVNIPDNLIGSYAGMFKSFMEYHPTYHNLLVCRCNTAITQQTVIQQSTDLKFKEGAVTQLDRLPDGSIKSLTISDVDYVVLTYQWTDEAGSDLDTRTFITEPLRDVKLGWGKSSYDNDYMVWGSDNTQSGKESVLITIDNLKRDNIGLDGTTVISMNAFWYGERRSGDINILYEVYRGGTMSQQGYTYVNKGGTKLAEFTINNNVSSTERDVGQCVAIFKITLETKVVSLEKVVVPDNDTSSITWDLQI